MKFNLVWFFLSFKGRISRQEFWLGYVGVILVVVLLVRPLRDNLQSTATPLRYPDEVEAAQWLPILLAGMLALWPVSAIYAKRLHDLNLSGWWQLLLPVIAFVELKSGFDEWNFIGMASIVVLGLLPGRRGGNRYGSDPRR